MSPRVVRASVGRRALPVLGLRTPRTEAQVVPLRVSPRSVRISVTDRCDMACVYCRPSRADGYLPAAERLDVEHWERLARGLVEEGVTRVRITGGEPLLFRGIVEVVERIARLGVDDLAMTTNASRLAAFAQPLREAGLRRLNVSIDSLDPERFRRLTRGGDLAGVLRGIEAALACGFDELKTNTVVVRGENEDELAAIVEWAWAHGITPRFLEIMGVGEGAKLFRTRAVSYSEMRASLAHLLEEAPARVDSDRGPAKYVPARGHALRRVGFITGTTETFCEDCDRLRATSDGVLRPCLARNDGVDASEALHADSDGAISGKLREAWAMKPDARWRGCTEATAAEVSMRGTGG